MRGRLLRLVNFCLGENTLHQKFDMIAVSEPNYGQEWENDGPWIMDFIVYTHHINCYIYTPQLHIQSHIG